MQQALPLLQHLDGSKASPSPTASASADSATSNTSSSAAGDAILSEDSPHQRLHVCFTQLSIQNTTPGRLPAPDAASEPTPPAYLYYLQLHTAQGGLVCSFPTVLTPQEELLQWQALQSAVPAAIGKKTAGKTGKGSKAGMADERKPWYHEVTFAA